jgi:5-methylcytosine-specific restriction endonuclease McrA
MKTERETGKPIAAHLHEPFSVRGEFFKGNEDAQFQLLERDKCCVFCRAPLNVQSAKIGHLVPLAKGGTDNMDNVILVCAKCNRDKKDLLPLEFIQVLIS